MPFARVIVKTSLCFIPVSGTFAASTYTKHVGISDVPSSLFWRCNETDGTTTGTVTPAAVVAVAEADGNAPDIAVNMSLAMLIALKMPAAGRNEQEPDGGRVVVITRISSEQ